MPSTRQKTAPDVFHDHFEKADHQKATRVNGRNLKKKRRNLKIPKAKNEGAKREFYQSGVQIYNGLPKHLKTEGCYLSFKQGLRLLYCITLYCIVLYCIVLYCIVLYCIVLAQIIVL